MPTQDGGRMRHRLPGTTGGLFDAKGPIMRFLLPLLALAAPANAHTGHLADLGGHDHWGLAIGLGAIAGAAVLGWLKGKRKEEEPEEESEPEEQAA